MRDPEFALEERSIQILTDPYKSILVSGILPLIFVTGLVKFVTAVARLVCLDLLGLCLSHFANINSGPSTCIYI